MYIYIATKVAPIIEPKVSFLQDTQENPWEEIIKQERKKQSRRER